MSEKKTPNLLELFVCRVKFVFLHTKSSLHTRRARVIDELKREKKSANQIGGKNIAGTEKKNELVRH